MPVMCFICEKIFSKQSSHNRHVREVHKNDPKPWSHGEASRWCNCCLEENCDNTFKDRKQLICHLEKNHSIQFEKYYSIKASVNEFKNWKNEIEQVNDCYYVLKSKAASTIGEVLYYNCNRSKTSYSTKDETQMKRLQKCQGSCKMTHSCTSYIKVTIENGKYVIEWQKTHYGHDFEQKHIRLPKPERHCIASKLISGVTTQRILESTRDKIGDPLKRIDLLTAKDIRNIKTSFNVESRDGKKHPNDAFSVDLWVQECMSGEENPILLYKPQGQDHSLLKNYDFCIILMNKFQRQMIQSFPNIIAVDSTHGLNGYDFEMTSIMVIDEFHHGFPVAEMFSNRKDIVIQNIFFTLIRESAGTVNCKIFMSDMEETFFNAWLNTMGGNAEHLFCSWHVDRAWQSNLSKINNKEKRAETYKILKTLQQHASEDVFFSSLQNAIGYLLSDTETKRFGEYFKNTYSHNIKKWAYCFRQNSSINTNMHLESMHKTIKYFYLERKTVKRLDRGLHAVIKYVRDKSVERIIRLTKGEHTKRTRQFTQHHKQAVQESHSYDVINNGSTWVIIQKNENKSYIVNHLLNVKCCREICLSCNICRHMYSCDCPFYKERQIICKHIHILVLKENICGHLVSPQSFTESMSVSESLTALSRENFNLDKEKKIEKIKNLLAVLDNCNYEKLDDSVISQVHQNLLVVNNLATCPGLLTNDNKFECQKNTNKRIINPQLRFVSTKKQRISANTSLKRATTSEVENIQENLRHAPEESFIVHSTSGLNDHQY